MVAGTRGPGLRKTEANRHPFGSLNILVEPGDSDDCLAGSNSRCGEARSSARRSTWHETWSTRPPPRNTPTRAGRTDPDRRRPTPGIAVEVWDETRIRQERFGGLAGRGRGLGRAAAFVVLDYRQGGDTPTLALVGKGVTFDSGGLSLKPSASMEDMKSDMTGAAVVAATMQAVARLELPVNVTGYLALTENMTGGKAMKLGDVLTMRNGKTVEVMNTDAEGRLILADALSYRRREQARIAILDLATLTGACMVGAGAQGRRALQQRRRTSARTCSPPAGRPANASGGCRSTTITRSSSRATSPT